MHSPSFPPVILLLEKRKCAKRKCAKQSQKTEKHKTTSSRIIIPSSSPSKRKHAKHNITQHNASKKKLRFPCNVNVLLLFYLLFGFPDNTLPCTYCLHHNHHHHHHHPSLSHVVYEFRKESKQRPSGLALPIRSRCPSPRRRTINHSHCSGLVPSGHDNAAAGKIRCYLISATEKKRRGVSELPFKVGEATQDGGKRADKYPHRRCMYEQAQED